MKILQLTNRFDGRGGVETYLREVCRLLAARGHESVVVYCEGLAEPERTGSDGGRSYWVDGNDLERLEAVIEQEQPAAAFVHHAPDAGLMRAVVERLPAVAYVHGFNAVCPGLGKYFRRGDRACERAFSAGCMPMHYLRHCSAARDPRTVARLMRQTAQEKATLMRAGALLVGSRYMRGLLIQNGFEAGRVKVLPPHFVTACGPYQPPETSNGLLFAGRLEIEKGLPYLLRALAALPERVRLRVAGDGTQRAAYERLAEELGITERIEFLGWLDEAGLAAEYQRCAVVVMPSVFPEPFGKVGVEAMASGRPVVGFDVGGISSWLRDEANGLLVQPASADKLAEGIGRLVDDPGEAEAMGQAGRERAMKEFEPQAHADGLEEAFSAVAGLNSRKFARSFGVKIGESDYCEC